MKLARWRNESSDGRWLLRDLPGGTLLHDARGWSLAALPPSSLLALIGQPETERVWGKSYDVAPTLQLLRDHPALRRCYRTRGELLEALNHVRAAEGAPAGSALSGVLMDEGPECA